METKSTRSTSPSKARYWQQHLDAQQRSGLSIERYCRKQGLAQSTFSSWRRRLDPRPSAAASPPLPMAIVPVPMHALREADSPFPGQRLAPLRLTVAERFRIDVTDDFASPVLEKLVTTLERLA